MMSEKINETNVVDTYVASTQGFPVIGTWMLQLLTYPLK